jgi:ketosteroid isomerase-like protein
MGTQELAVRAAEQHRCAAMLGNDAAALDALLDPRLAFCHATGQVDDKSAYMAKIAAGRITYLSIDWRDDQVEMLASGVALLSGQMTSHVTVEGSTKRLDNRVLAVWTATDGAWRLTAFQPTPLKL